MTLFIRSLAFSVFLIAVADVAFSQDVSNESLNVRLENTERELKIYKAKLDSIISIHRKYERLADSLESTDAFIPKFKPLRVLPYTKFSSGFMATNTDDHSGLFTGAIEVVGLQFNYYSKRKIGSEIVQGNVSPFLSIGWGPMLVAENLIYNYGYLSGGVSINQFSSNVSYGGVFGFNTSGDKATQYVYGFTISLDNIQTPVFASVLFGDKGFQYMTVLGLKIPLTYLIPHRSERF